MSDLDITILVLWRMKLNTAEIGRVLHVREAEVHNRLGWLRGHQYTPREVVA